MEKTKKKQVIPETFLIFSQRYLCPSCERNFSIIRSRRVDVGYIFRYYEDLEFKPFCVFQVWKRIRLIRASKWIILRKSFPILRLRFSFVIPKSRIEVTIINTERTIGIFVEKLLKRLDRFPQIEMKMKGNVI